MIIKITADNDRKTIDVLGTETLREICDEHDFTLTSVVYVNGSAIQMESFDVPVEEFDILEQGRIQVNISNKPSGGCK